MEKASVVHDLAAGEPLFVQGDPAAAIYKVESGQLRLVRRIIDGHTARQGEFFAEAALFADATAAAPSRVRTYPKTKMKEALRSNPAFTEAFTAGLARQLQNLRSRMELRNIRSARERVLRYLRLRAGSQGRRIAIDGQLQDIAAEIGVTREAYYRTLAALCGGVGSALAQAASPGADQPHDMPLPATLETAVFAHFITNQLEGRFGYINSLRWNAGTADFARLPARRPTRCGSQQGFACGSDRPLRSAG